MMHPVTYSPLRNYGLRRYQHKSHQASRSLSRRKPKRKRRRNSRRRHYYRNPDIPKLLTPELKEIMSVVPPESSEGRQFQEFMESLLLRLFPKLDLKKRPIQFVIVDEDDINAFCGPPFKPTLMGFSKGLLEKVNYVEDLAGILGHEFTHKRFSDAYGIKHKNTKLEELTADLWPLSLLYEAGLDPRQYVSFVTKVIFNRDSLSFSFRKLFDVHPLHETRIRALEDSLAALDQWKGGLDDLTPEVFPKSFADTAKAASHISFIDHYLSDTNFEHKDIPEKFDILIKLFDDIYHMGDNFKISHSVNMQRFKNLTSSLKKIKISRLDPLQSKAHDNLADAFLEVFIKDVGQTQEDKEAWDIMYSGSERSLYRVIVGIGYRSLANRAVGRLRVYQACIDQFIEARTMEEAKNAAEHCLTMAANDILLKKRPLFLFDLNGFDNFKEPERANRKVSWNRHVSWGKESLISLMLLALGIIDNRIFEFSSPKLEIDFNQGEFYKFAKPLTLEVLMSGDEMDDEDDDDDDDDDEDDEDVYDGDGYGYVHGEYDHVEHEMVSGLISNIQIDDDGYVSGYLKKRLTVENLRGEERFARYDENSEQFSKEAKIIAKKFLEVPPGDVEAENNFIRYTEETLKGLEFPFMERNWLALDNAEYNFPLFVDINLRAWLEVSSGLSRGMVIGGTDVSEHAHLAKKIMREDRSGGSSSRDADMDTEDSLTFIGNLTDKLYEMAESGDKNQIEAIRRFMLSGERATLSANFVEGCLLPIYDVPYQYLSIFVLDNPNNIFTHKEQLYYLNEKSSMETTQDSFTVDFIDTTSLDKLRVFLGYSEPKSGKDYLKLQLLLDESDLAKESVGFELFHFD